MANCVIDVAKLLKNNSYGPTDFTIQSGEYSWKIHSKLLIRESARFAELCGDDPTFLNATEVAIDLGTPWSVARLIQFLYLNDYEYYTGYEMTVQRQYDYLSSNQEYQGPLPCLLPSLHQLVPSSHHKDNCGDFDLNRLDPDRLEVSIDVDVTKVAAECQFRRLMDVTQENLVLFLERRVRTGRFIQDIAELYPHVHRALSDSLWKDGSLVHRMVEVLMAFKFGNFDKDFPYTIYVSPNGLTDRSPVILGLQRHIGEYISAGGIFAIALVHALENALQKTLQDPEWPLEVFQVDVTDFGGPPENGPVDGGSPVREWEQ